MKLILYYNLMLHAGAVAQVAKPARPEESATSTGRFGNLRYAGPRNISYNFPRFRAFAIKILFSGFFKVP
jgi:hypothetical protein